MTRIPNILIVDDEYEKVKAIFDIVKDEMNVNFEHVTNSQHALQKIKDTMFDLLVIDLQIPESLGGDVEPDGGKKLLEYISISDNLIKPTHILGITSHADSFENCNQTFIKHGWSLVLGVNDHERILNLIRAKINHAVNPPIKYDVAILTALTHTELEAILKWDCEWIPVHNSDDSNIYYSAFLTNKDGKSISLIITSCHNMGIAQASAIGMKICLNYKPDYIFMTGIAAGIEGKVKLGDILVADICWDWGSGKQTIIDGKPKFLSAPRQLSIEPILKSKLKKISINRKYLDDIYNKWPANSRPDTVLNMHVGPIATGSFVIEDPSIIEMIQSQHRETIGVEMEAYGLALASSISSRNPPKTIIVKSVCDFADPEKNDKWHDYAAYTSSQLVKYFIENELYDS